MKASQIKTFEETIVPSDDNLPRLTKHLREFTDSTGVYIGVMEKPKKEIDDTADDSAHVDEEAIDEIKYIHATPDDHTFLLNKVVKQDEGVLHQLWGVHRALEGEEEEEPPAEEEAEGEEEEDEDKMPPHIFVEDVTREPRIKFFKVPKLGSFLGIRMSYQSCLFAEALDLAIENIEEVEAKIEAQEEEKKEWLEEQEAEKEAQLKEGNEEFEIQPHPPDKEWEDYKPEPFKTVEKSLVVCLDILGKDGKYTEQQINFALQVVKDYISKWEEVERQQLTADVNRRIEAKKQDQFFIEHE